MDPKASVLPSTPQRPTMMTIMTTIMPDFVRNARQCDTNEIWNLAIIYEIMSFELAKNLVARFQPLSFFFQSRVLNVPYYVVVHTQ